MARETDFFVLYKILGLNANCNLDDFKRAYRRRVAVLHPDRRTNSQNSAVSAERLQQLMALYTTAMEFHREHGRLPGAARMRQPHLGNAIPASQRIPIGTSRPQSRQWLFLLAAAVAVWMLRPTSPPGPTTAPTTHAQADGYPDQSQSLPVPLLTRGMDSTSVRAREGAPDSISPGERWEYGSSWIRFDNGKVTDWYSSPLHPLNATTAHRLRTPD
ncbi:MAG: J domain-containing protein [Rhodanobacter sp.]|jgi:hypothetical protein|nr:J domain-containing protein [Rhodanobacter sp.]